MPPKMDAPENDLKIDENQTDTSIDDAKWLLGSVAMLGLIVIAVGLFSSTLSV